MVDMGDNGKIAYKALVGHGGPFSTAWPAWKVAPSGTGRCSGADGLEQGGLHVMKLNLGCGNNKKDGYINVDKYEACGPDQQVDLEQFPWPWPDGSVEEIMLNHVLEHLGATTETYFGIIRELYRVSVDRALIKITVPHPRHDSFIHDPTHVRVITPQGLELFSRKLNADWAKNGTASSPLGLYLGVDFEIEKVDMVPAEPWRTRFKQGKISSDELMGAARQFNNVMQEISILWRAVKS